MQTGNTSTMIFSVAENIVHLGQMSCLHPGDVMKVGIEGLGVQRQKVRQDA